MNITLIINEEEGNLKRLYIMHGHVDIILDIAYYFNKSFSSTRIYNINILNKSLIKLISLFCQYFCKDSFYHTHFYSVNKNNILNYIFGINLCLFGI